MQIFPSSRLHQGHPGMHEKNLEFPSARDLEVRKPPDLHLMSNPQHHRPKPSLSSLITTTIAIQHPHNLLPPRLPPQPQVRTHQPLPAATRHSLNSAQTLPPNHSSGLDPLDSCPSPARNEKLGTSPSPT